jgi:cytochrome c biogenesis protein
LNDNQQNPIDAIWDFFCSLKLSITTLILLATTSILGTVIEQGSTPEAMAQKHGWSLGLMQFLDRFLDAFNMYHSWWFIGLLGLFAVNLICCSIKRLPRVWYTVQNPVLTPDDNLLRSCSNREEFVVKGEEAALREKVNAFLTSRFTTATVNEKDGKTYFYAEKGAWSRFGVYITHASILIIFIGALMGSFWGYKGYVSIPEGGETDRVYRRDQQAEAPLGFAVRCESFSVSYYEGTRRPREFKSVLTVSENGQVVIKDRKVIVNEPLTYKGITFYQSSYNPIGDPSFAIQARERASGRVVDLNIPFGAQRPLPGGGAVRVENYGDNGMIVRLGVTGSDGQRRVVDIYDPSANISDERRGGEYVFTLTGFNQRYATGLQVAKDPGVEVVWLGCFLMVIGTMVAFFMSHRRIWVVLSPGNQGMNLLIAGNANRNQPAFEIGFDELKKEFKNEFSS